MVKAIIVRNINAREGRKLQNVSMSILQSVLKHARGEAGKCAEVCSW